MVPSDTTAPCHLEPLLYFHDITACFVAAAVHECQFYYSKIPTEVSVIIGVMPSEFISSAQRKEYVWTAYDALNVK